MKKTVISITCAAATLVSGCGSAPQKTVDQHVQERTYAAKPVLQGKTVSLDISLFQRTEKRTSAPDSQLGKETKQELHPIRRTKDEHMERGVLLEDARLQLKTNDQLDFFEKYLASTIVNFGGQVAKPGEAADLTLNAKLIYGPVPAPAYRSYNLGKSLGMSLITLGLGPRSYDAVVDYELNLSLLKAEKPMAVHSDSIKKSSEELKSRFNFGDRAEVQEVAMEAFRVTLEAQVQSFASRVSEACSTGC